MAGDRSRSGVKAGIESARAPPPTASRTARVWDSDFVTGRMRTGAAFIAAATDAGGSSLSIRRGGVTHTMVSPPWA
jgi:hypothetical protein